MCSCTQVVSIEKQAVVHPEDTAAFPEVLIEEQQILWNPLQKPEGVLTKLDNDPDHQML